MCIAHVSVTHVISFYFYTCNTDENTTHVLQVSFAEIGFYAFHRLIYKVYKNIFRKMYINRVCRLIDQDYEVQAMFSRLD